MFPNLAHDENLQCNTKDALSKISRLIAAKIVKFQLKRQIVLQSTRPTNKLGPVRKPTRPNIKPSRPTC